MTLMSLVVIGVFLLWASFICHLIVHLVLRRRDAGTLVLAPLPRSAAGVKAYSWSTLFSGEDFVRFTAEPNDIERFIAVSPALQGQEPQRYSRQKMRLPRPQPRDAEGGFDMSNVNEYVAPHPAFPDWYKQEVRGPAHKYKVQPPRYQYPGEVLVDDETHTVYVHLIFS